MQVESRGITLPGELGCKQVLRGKMNLAYTKTKKISAMCTMIGEFRLGNKAKLRKLRKSSKWSWLLSEEAQPFMSKHQIVLMGERGV